MSSASKVHLVILAIIVIVHVCELLVVTEKFGCFNQAPNFENIGPRSEMACRVSLLWRRGVFYEYKEGMCYIDTSGSDDYEGNCAGRFFETIDLNQIGVGNPTSSSSFLGPDVPSNAVDNDSLTMFHTEKEQLENWWTLDLLRPYDISSIKVLYRSHQLERSFNIKIYVSTFLDSTDLFSNLRLFARQGTPPSTAEVTYTPESGQASMCGRYVVITKKVTSEIDIENRILEFMEVQPIIEREILDSLLQNNLNSLNNLIV